MCRGKCVHLRFRAFRFCWWALQSESRRIGWKAIFAREYLDVARDGWMGRRWKHHVRLSGVGDMGSSEEKSHNDRLCAWNNQYGVSLSGLALFLYLEDDKKTESCLFYTELGDIERLSEAHCWNKAAEWKASRNAYRYWRLETSEAKNDADRWLACTGQHAFVMKNHFIWWLSSCVYTRYSGCDDFWVLWSRYSGEPNHMHYKWKLLQEIEDYICIFYNAKRFFG